MKVVLTLLPIALIAGTLVVAFARRGKPVRWGTWSPSALTGFVALLFAIGGGISWLGTEIAPRGLRITVALAGLLFFSGALYVLLTGGQTRQDDS